jgi:hypothetical protein
METIERKLEIENIKEEIKTFMEENIQPLLKIEEATNVIGRNYLIEFHYDVVTRKKNNFIYFTFKFLINKKGLSVSVILQTDATINKIYTEGNLEEVLFSLNKEVKKYAFTRLYNK